MIKYAWCAITVMFFLGGGSAQAQEPDDPSKDTATNALSPEDQAKMREQLKQLAEAFGIQALPQNNQTDRQNPPQKSAADVADKALEMVGGLVSQVSETLQKVAPDVWRMMIRQQYAKAIADLLVPWLLVLLSFVLWSVLNKKWVKTVEHGTYMSDEEISRMVFVSIIPTVSGIIFGVWGIVALSSSIKYIVNPEYYAVRDILLMLLHPQQVR